MGRPRGTIVTSLTGEQFTAQAAQKTACGKVAEEGLGEIFDTLVYDEIAGALAQETGRSKLQLAWEHAIGKGNTKMGIMKDVCKDWGKHRNLSQVAKKGALQLWTPVYAHLSTSTHGYSHHPHPRTPTHTYTLLALDRATERESRALPMLWWFVVSLSHRS